MGHNHDLVINRLKGIVGQLLARYNIPTDSPEGNQIYQKAYDDAMDLCVSKDYDVFNSKDEMKLTKELRDLFEKQFQIYGQRNY